MNPIREALESVADKLEAGTNETAEVGAAPVEGGDGGGAEVRVPSESLPDGDGLGGQARSGESDDTATQSAERTRDDKGRFATGKAEAKGSQAPVASKPSVTVKPTPAQASATPATPAPVVTPTEVLKAPQSWKPLAREKWAGLPAEVQAEALRREKEIATALQEAAPAKKEAETWRQVVGPFEAQIRADGSNPYQAVHSMLQTASALRDPRRAPGVIAQLVKSFRVPIEALAAELDGQPASAQQAPEYRDPRVDQLLEHAQQAAARKEQAALQKAQLAIAQFAETAEFLEDVKPRMRALMLEAHENGQELSLQDAYDAACWSNKEVRATLQERERVNAAKAGMASTQQARAAASSLKSQPAGHSGSSAKPGSIRAALEAAADAKR